MTPEELDHLFTYHHPCGVEGLYPALSFAKDCPRIAADELIKARWQANSSIALHIPNKDT